MARTGAFAQNAKPSFEKYLVWERSYAICEIFKCMMVCNKRSWSKPNDGSNFVSSTNSSRGQNPGGFRMCRFDLLWTKIAQRDSRQPKTPNCEPPLFEVGKENACPKKSMFRPCHELKTQRSQTNSTCVQLLYLDAKMHQINFSHSKQLHLATTTQMSTSKSVQKHKSHVETRQNGHFFEPVSNCNAPLRKNVIWYWENCHWQFEIQTLTLILHFTCHQFGNATLENSGRGSQFVYFDPQRYKMRNSRTNTSAFSCIKMDWSLNEFKPQSVARPRASCIELGCSFSLNELPRARPMYFN